MKVTGQKIHEFLEEDWDEAIGKGAYFEDSEIDPYNEQGEFILEPETLYSLRKFGYIRTDDPEVEFSFEQGYNKVQKWLNSKGLSNISLQLPKSDTEFIINLAKEKGWSIL